jgi:hypothetical protein
MLTINKTTKNGGTATIWDIKEFHMENTINVIRVYGFWDTDHLNAYDAGTVPKPADVISTDIQVSLDPLNATVDTDQDLSVNVSDLLAEGKSVKQICKIFLEKYLIDNHPEWSEAIQS